MLKRFKAHISSLTDIDTAFFLAKIPPFNLPACTIFVWFFSISKDFKDELVVAIITFVRPRPNLRPNPPIKSKAGDHRQTDGRRLLIHLLGLLKLPQQMALKLVIVILGGARGVITGLNCSLSYGLNLRTGLKSNFWTPDVSIDDINLPRFSIKFMSVLPFNLY